MIVKCEFSFNPIVYFEDPTNKMKQTTSTSKKPLKIQRPNSQIVDQPQPVKSLERAICEVIGSAFIDEIGGENSSLFELGSLPLLFRELHDACLKKLFERRPVGSCVLAFGCTYYGQLGLDVTNERDQPVIVSSLTGFKIVKIACSNIHSLALLESGEVLSWGSNSEGQLGVGDYTEERKSPTKITALKGKQVSDISCGEKHSLALTEDSSIFVWGSNKCGQLGLNDTKHFQTTPTLLTLLKGKEVSKIFCGPYLSFVILQSNEVFACGQNHSGQLGIGDISGNNTFVKQPQEVVSLSGKNITAISFGLIHSLALSENGEVFFAGNENLSETRFQLPNQISFKLIEDLIGKKAISISCGSYHCSVLVQNGDLYCWGDNEFGQLGIGGTLHRLTPTKVQALNGKKVVKISCGLFYNFAITEAKEIYCWGTNEAGDSEEEEEEEEANESVNKRTPILNKFLQGKEVIDIVCSIDSAMALVK